MEKLSTVATSENFVNSRKPCDTGPLETVLGLFKLGKNTKGKGMGNMWSFGFVESKIALSR
jgi:hypothetical protein